MTNAFSETNRVMQAFMLSEAVANNKEELSKFLSELKTDNWADESSEHCMAVIVVIICSSKFASGIKAEDICIGLTEN